MTSGSVYIHVPFCAKKCPYCHFFVQPLQDVKTYIEGIKKEWEFRKHSFDHLVSIYLGGGTPSLLTLSEVEKLLNLFPNLASEVTIEANPDDITFEKMRGYISCGINRLSVGVQSLDDSNLQSIQRTHSAKKAKSGIEIAARAGFTNISIDLMYDLPNQTFSHFKNTVDQALILPITHLSIYNLIFEEGSVYYKKRKELSKQTPNEDESLKMLEYVVYATQKRDFNRYEISAFCKDGKESIHNCGYWSGRPFIGLGPSAFSYIDGKRFKNVSHLKKWATAIFNNSDPKDFEESLPYPQNINELLAIRLRLLKGVDLNEFENIPKESLSSLKSLESEGFVTRKQDRIALSEKGKLFYDYVAAELV